MEQTIPLISIIVPVYKVEKYLPACIDSILAQTYENFELILVDDGSPDNCGKICDEYAQKDNRIKVIHQENGGVTKARATGVNQASGEFITFVDSDDTIPNDAIESLCKCISPNIDIIIGKISGQEEFPFPIKKNTYLSVAIDSYRCCHLLQYIPSGPVAKLFRKKLFNQNVLEIPREIKIGEDWLMNIRLSFNTSKNVSFINQVVYNYLIHDISITNTYKTDTIYDKVFFKYYMASIPKSESSKFMFQTITMRLKRFLIATGYKTNITSETRLCYSSLYEDIKSYNYKAPLMVKCLLYVKKPLLRLLIISIRKLLNKLHINSTDLDTKYLNSLMLKN